VSISTAKNVDGDIFATSPGTLTNRSHRNGEQLGACRAGFQHGGRPGRVNLRRYRWVEPSSVGNGSPELQARMRALSGSYMGRNDTAA